MEAVKKGMCSVAVKGKVKNSNRILIGLYYIRCRKEEFNRFTRTKKC